MKNSMGFPANRSFISIAASLLLGLSLFLASAGQAHANDAIDALEKVCGVADGFCGPDFKSVAQDCFHASKGDEIKCAVTILSAVSGAGNVGDKIQTIIECAKDIKNLDAVQGDCKSALDALNLGDQYNEAVGIIKTCAKIQNASGVASTVDDVIVCAESFTASITRTTADALLLAKLLSLRAFVWPATGNVPVAGAVKLMSQVIVSPCPLLPGNKSTVAGNGSGAEFTSTHCATVTPGVFVAQVAS